MYCDITFVRVLHLKLVTYYNVIDYIRVRKTLKHCLLTLITKVLIPNRRMVLSLNEILYRPCEPVKKKKKKNRHFLKLHRSKNLFNYT